MNKLLKVCLMNIIKGCVYLLLLIWRIMTYRRMLCKRHLWSFGIVGGILTILLKSNLFFILLSGTELFEYCSASESGVGGCFRVWKQRFFSWQIDRDRELSHLLCRYRNTFSSRKRGDSIGFGGLKNSEIAGSIGDCWKLCPYAEKDSL